MKRRWWCLIGFSDSLGMRNEAHYITTNIKLLLTRNKRSRARHETSSIIILSQLWELLLSETTDYVCDTPDRVHSTLLVASPTSAAIRETLRRWSTSRCVFASHIPLPVFDGQPSLLKLPDQRWIMPIAERRWSAAVIKPRWGRGVVFVPDGCANRQTNRSPEHPNPVWWPPWQPLYHR